MYAFNPDLTQKWESASTGNLIRGSVAIGADGTIYAGGNSGFYAFGTPLP
jgi:outer membrane protein assembly factor BamB